ncbi:MAG: TonB-dependent receptor [Acidobacteriaceae bacterium]|nr:TonB-dependent receptor [Acidobacteriaceae bacterium]
MKTLVLLACLIGVSGWTWAQKSQDTPEVRTTVVVVGAPDALAEENSARSTRVLGIEDRRLALSDNNDVLRSDPAVDIQQRGGAGVQADLSIRGSSYEQTLVLLNGLRINDAETSHFNLDLPVPMAALATAHVLHGAGSTLYGSDAVSGVVNFVTAPAQDGLRLRLQAGGGSFGGQEQSALASWGKGKLSQVFAAGRDFSSGFMPDRDYRSEEASSETRFHSVLGESDVLLAGSDRAFGANAFYGNYTSWERTKGWFAGLSQQIDSKTQAAVAFRRHTDIFLLTRSNPLGYKNQHIDTSWQGVVRRQDALPWKPAKVFYGLETNADQIDSTNLGRHGRNRGAGYVDLEVRGRGKGTLSVGLREEVFSGGNAVLVPSVAGSFWMGQSLKARASIGRGYRLPTYTDLYYNDPTTVGNAALQPESAWSFDGGLDWYQGHRFSASVTGFHSRQTNAIDYVRASTSEKWRAANLTGVRLTGAEAAIDWRPISGQTVRVAFTQISGAREALQGLQSVYVFNFPTQNAGVEWIGRWKNGVLLRPRVRAVHRLARDVYPVWDAAAAWEGRQVQPYFRMTNGSDSQYQELIGVPMPGRAYIAGVVVLWGKAK